MFDIEEDAHSNSQANWLSTIIKIYNDEWYLLLTSDAPRQVLKRVGIEEKDEFRKSNLFLGQSPHHGTAGNHYDGFWKTKLHLKDTPIVFSVGKNIYKHPQKKR